MSSCINGIITLYPSPIVGPYQETGFNSISWGHSIIYGELAW